MTTLIRFFLQLLYPARTRDAARSGLDGGDPFCDACDGFHPAPFVPCNAAEAD